MLLQHFQVYFHQQFPHLTTNNCKLLLAVSGGLDSVVLADILHKTNTEFAIAHCNFKLRGAESERDETFVKTLAQQYNKELFVTHFNTKIYAEENKLSIQEAARNLRYNWFTNIVTDWKNAEKEQGNRQFFIATAHHANDNIETLLINFFRGTGISGLHGILPKQNQLLRPLLFATREQIKQYAAENNLQWVEDSSNTSEKYTRNFFRLNLLPALKDIYPNVEQNLLQNIERFGEVETLYKQAITLHIKKLVDPKGNELHIPVLKLKKAEPQHSILWEIIKNFAFTAAQVNDVKKLLDAESGKYVASATHRIIKNRNWLIVAPLQTTDAANILIEKKDKEIVFEGGSVQFAILDIDKVNLSTSPLIAAIDAAQVSYPFLLRKYKLGDYFYPLGMQKKKKLNRFFIDQKLSATDKEKVWVIEANKKIVWIVGYRIDDRFKITPNTKNALLIKAEPLA